MKRLFACLLTLLMVTSALVITTSAASTDTTLMLDFKASRYYELPFDSHSNNVLDYEWSEECIKATANTENANGLLGFYIDMNAEDAKWIRVRVKNETLGEDLEMFYSANHEAHAAHEIELNLKMSYEDKEFKEYVVSIESILTNGKWEGNLQRIGIGFAEGPRPAKGESISIDYIAFFKTEAEAKNFDPAAWRTANPAKVQVTTDAPTHIVDFSAANEAAIRETFNQNPADCTIEFLEDALKATATKESSNWAIGQNVNFNAQDARYVKMRIKNPSDGGVFEMWISTIQSGNYRLQFQAPIKTGTTSFDEYVFDMQEYMLYSSGSLWVGDIARVRYDFSENPRVTTGATFEIDYIAFFSTKEAADKFDINEWRKTGGATAVETITAAPETTKAPETTAAPVTTAAPTTTKTPTQTPATADGSFILAAALCMSLVAVVCLRKRAK